MKTTINGKRYNTNSKQVRDAMRKHILDAVTDENGDTLSTFEQAKERLAADFDRVANYPNNIHRFPNEEGRFHDYLMGVPYSFEFANHEITNFLNNLGINPCGKEYDTDKSARLYTYLIFKETF